MNTKKIRLSQFCRIFKNEYSIFIGINALYINIIAAKFFSISKNYFNITFPRRRRQLQGICILLGVIFIVFSVGLYNYIFPGEFDAAINAFSMEPAQSVNYSGQIPKSFVLFIVFYVLYVSGAVLLAHGLLISIAIRSAIFLRSIDYIVYTGGLVTIFFGLVGVFGSTAFESTAQSLRNLNKYSNNMLNELNILGGECEVLIAQGLDKIPHFSALCTYNNSISNEQDTATLYAKITEFCSALTSVALAEKFNPIYIGPIDAHIREKFLILNEKCDIRNELLSSYYKSDNIAKIYPRIRALINFITILSAITISIRTVKTTAEIALDLGKK